MSINFQITHKWHYSFTGEKQEVRFRCNENFISKREQSVGVIDRLKKEKAWRMI